MRINYFKRIIVTALAVVFFTSLFAQIDNVYLIGGPINKNDPNWLLDQKVELSQDINDPSIFYYKGYLAYNWRGDERGNIKFLVANDWNGAFHPVGDVDQLLSGTTSMRQDGNDTKWFIPADRSADGYYELTLNTQLLTLNVDSFRSDLNPEKIFAVGASLPCGWDNNNPELLTRTDPEVAVYTWTGIMNSGDFKFLTPMSIGSWDYTYGATTVNESVSLGVEQDLVFEVRNSAETTFNDSKFVMNETVECTLTVDLVNNKMTVTKNGELYAQDIWITGSAIPGEKAKLVSDNIDPLIHYHYYGPLLDGEFKFTSTENINPTTQFYVPTSSSDAFSDNVDVSLTADANTSGWTVSQSNDLSKIKLNILTNEYSGSIYSVEHVYIVGDATAIGWDAGNAIELTKGSGDDSLVFTFDGNLAIRTEGEAPDKFKFLLQNDWGPLGFHPQTENELITEAQYITDHISDDYKWTVDAEKQGRYVIQINALEETINATYYPETPTKLSTLKLDDIYILGVKGEIQVMSEIESVKRLEVFDIGGGRVARESFVHNVEIELSKGIYIVKINDGNALMIKKVVVL